MKLFVIIILSLFLIQNCAAQQSQLPKEMPARIAVGFTENGGMLRAYTKISIADDVLEFEELKGDQPNPQKWSAAISREELTKLYQIFVENKFDTIKNDERKGIVYDAGSEGITISVSETKSFNISYGKNSPLSGKNLERYQAVRNAIHGLLASRQNTNQTTSENEVFIQGTWHVTGQNGGASWFLEWTFANGNFKQNGYPPIMQEGKYRVTAVDGDKITLELYDQKGTFGEKTRALQILIDKTAGSLTISGTKGFSKITEKKTNKN